MSAQVPEKLTKRQQSRHDNRQRVAKWAIENGCLMIGNGINPHNQADIFAAALRKAGVQVHEVRRASANTTIVTHDRVDRNGVVTRSQVGTAWAKKRPPNGRLAELGQWIALVERIGTVGTPDNLPDIECAPYAAAILCKHLDNPAGQIRKAIREHYERNACEPFKKAYHMFNIGEDAVLGIKFKEGRLKVQYAFQPGRTAWLKAGDINLRMNFSETVKTGLVGATLGQILDTGNCPYLAELGRAQVKTVHDNGAVTSLRLHEETGSLWDLIEQYQHKAA